MVCDESGVYSISSKYRRPLCDTIATLLCYMNPCCSSHLNYVRFRQKFLLATSVAKSDKEMRDTSVRSG